MAESDDKQKNAPTDAETSSKDIAVEALNHLLQGKRHLLVHDYWSAVASLQEACQLFDSKYGVAADECGEAYLQYGTALLELARLEDGLFDGTVATKMNEMSGEEEESEDDDDDDEEEDSQDDSQDNKESDEAKADEKKEGETEEDIEVSDEEKKEETKPEKAPEPVPQNSDAANQRLESDLINAPSTSSSSTSKVTENKPENEDSDENDASNIEVAWEVLLLAKGVFERLSSQPQMKLKLAETLQKLGEISIEWENNLNAIDILTESLTLRKEVLPEDDRLIAETYYHLGIAFSFNNQCDRANECFYSAIQVIQSRIANQRTLITTSSDADKIEAAEREIIDLENLLPEMRCKIEDSQDQMNNERKAMEQEAIERKKEVEATARTQEVREMPVRDISHLIKRKRPNSESESSAPQKVLCSNGNNVLNNDNRSDIQTNLISDKASNG